MGKHVIDAADGPGFLVNRCNRPFSLEALRLVQERLATPEQVDRICRMAGGFRMGPFELMDLVGLDVGLAVAKSFYEQSFGEPRWRPSPLVARLVAAGRLGRKTGRGWYEYPRGPPATSTPPTTSPDDPVLERIVAQLVNEACFALGEGVGSAEDIDAGMVLGLNHPRGPLEWGDEIGAAGCWPCSNACTRSTARSATAPRRSCCAPRARARRCALRSGRASVSPTRRASTLDSMRASPRRGRRCCSPLPRPPAALPLDRRADVSCPATPPSASVRADARDLDRRRAAGRRARGRWPRASARGTSGRAAPAATWSPAARRARSPPRCAAAALLVYAQPNALRGARRPSRTTRSPRRPTTGAPMVADPRCRRRRSPRRAR